jgi:hypothetical protein
MRIDGLKRRIEAVEANAKSPVISTLSDLVAYVASGSNGEAVLSPGLQELVNHVQSR